MDASGERQYPDVLPHAPLGHRGRGAALNPGNRYEGDPKSGVIRRLHVLGDFLDREQAEADGAGCAASTLSGVGTEVIEDHTRSIINPVNSPDLGFRWSINPYRGCEHGCIYCYARPDHERLGYSCGLDFETKILTKKDAAVLLRKELARPKWKPETIMMAGVTDIYQPIERELRITRDCLEVLAECRQPVALITKNRLITRDIDLLAELAKFNAVRAAVSITTLDNRLASKMEPRASAPAERLAAVKELSRAGIVTAVMVAPIIPGLTDREIPSILKAARDAGARSAGYVLLRLPHQVKALFLEWLVRHFPDRAAHVESLIRQFRGGDLYDPTFGVRQRGKGPIAEQVNAMFTLFERRYGLDRAQPPLSGASFRRPAEPPAAGQRMLFEP